MEQYLTEAEQLYKDQRYEEALAAYEQAIRLSMPNPDPRLFYGRAAVYKQLAQQAYDLAKQSGYNEVKSEEVAVNSKSTPATMSLDELIKYTVQELSKYRRKEPSNDEYCLEIFRRATVLQDSEAWAALNQLFTESLRVWIKRHPAQETAMCYESEQYYLNEAFRRFKLGTIKQKPRFTTLGAALYYLKTSLNGAIMDTVRTYSQQTEQSFPVFDDPLVEDNYQDSELWKSIESVITSEKERRLAYLLYHVNLKPREIIRYIPGEFKSVKEIQVLKRNILDRLVRNREFLRYNLENP